MRVKAKAGFTYLGKAFSSGDMVQLPILIANQLLRQDKIEFITMDQSSEEVHKYRLVKPLYDRMQAHIKNEDLPAIPVPDKKLWQEPHTGEYQEREFTLKPYADKSSKELLDTFSPKDSTSDDIPDGVGEPPVSVLKNQVEETLK